MQPKADYVMPLSDASARLSQVGGKGASLARLAAACLPVPPGFHITTAAYRRFVAEHGLQEQILAAVSAATPDQPATLEEVSSQIGKLFAQNAMPDEIAEAIRRAYADLGGGDVPVAVRSSATAEDLPEMSFAGQQETYLNIQGAEAVLEAIKKCWASLWTARAIAYRARQGIAPDSVALAVVVQVLIQADAAGVLFTANPMSGSRDELVINANWGLGEALVSGRVSPDTLLVNKKNGRVLRATVAVKSLMTVTGAQGTHEVAVPEERRTKRVLSNSEARQLAGLARQIEGVYGSLQDVEWCRADRKFYIVQSRPITRMPPEWPVPERGMFYGRSSLVEFLPGPLSPLFETFGLVVANDSSREMMLRLTQVAWKYDLYTAMNGFMYVVGPTRPRDLWFYVIMTVRLMGNMRRSGVAHWYEARDVLRSAAAAWEGRALAEMSPAELLTAARGLMKAATDYYGVLQSTIIPMSTLAETSFTQLYNRLIRRKEDPDASVLLVGGETDALRAEKSLFELYGWVRERPELAAWLGTAPAAEIVARLSSGSGPETLAPDGWQGWVERLRAHQRAWGHLLYDFDFASPLLCEDPLPAIEALKNHLAGYGIDPNLRRHRQLEKRANLRAEIGRRLDPLRRKWFNQSLDRAVERGPLREDAIAAMGLAHPALRRIFGELGARLAGGGGLERAGDIYWLRAAELEEAAHRLEQNQPLVEMSADVQARKTAHQQRLTFSPPPVLPRDSFLRRLMPPEDSYQAEGNTLKGVGASGGSVTAPACVILRAEDFARMRPGDVLVAVNTTPAWTPLFALASAVVTDIGGPLSHSSIVAREYGIPAVMATGAATRRIQNGQTITVDGTAGTVTLA